MSAIFDRQQLLRRNRLRLVWGLGAALVYANGLGEASTTTATADEVTVAAVGDIMLGGTATPELAKFGYDYPFEHVRALLSRADIAFGNLEGPLTARGQAAANKRFVFRSPGERVAPALARAGIDVVSLANNHIMDFGRDGLVDTVNALAHAGIRHAGAGDNLAAARAPTLLEVKGKKIAFLAYSLTFPEEFWATAAREGAAFGHEQQVRADVAAADRVADLVLVSFHWGREGTTELRDYQKQLGRAAIDAGAVAVLGHHPHVLQAVERYRHGVILYSLGNFVFGSYSADARHSVIATLVFRDDRLQRLELNPINVKNVDVVFQPRLLTGDAADEVVRSLQQLSAAQATVLENVRGVAVFDAQRATAQRAP